MRCRTSLLLGAVTVLAGVLPASASAATGSYQVTACNDAPETVNNSWAWSTTDSSQPSHYAEHTNCPYRLGNGGDKNDQEGGLSTTDALGLPNGAAPGTTAGWTFTASTGTTITAITYERYIGHLFDPKNYWSSALRADGTIVPGETCTDSISNSETCFVGGPPGEGGTTGVVTGLFAHQLTFGEICEAPSPHSCVTGAAEHSIWTAMYGARVTVNDPTPPALASPSGALWEASSSDGFQEGTESVTTSAQDVGGGVQSIVLSADGQPVETYSAPCDFTFAQPCPLSTGAQILTLPTAQLSDGVHTLTLVATDAAGNRSTVASEQITVENNPPPPPTELVAVPTQIDGSAGDGSGAGGLGSGGSGGSGIAPPPKAAVHVTEAIHGRELVVHVSGPATGSVRVSFTGRYRGRPIASGAKTVVLKHGRLTATFKLSVRAAAHATIRVSARPFHGLAVTSILHRWPRRSHTER